MNTWRLLVERGFYAFDGDPQDGSYRRVGVPCEPRRIVDVGVEVAAVALTAHLVTVRFDLHDRVGSVAIWSELLPRHQILELLDGPSSGSIQKVR